MTQEHKPSSAPTSNPDIGNTPPIESVEEKHTGSNPARLVLDKFNDNFYLPYSTNLSVRRNLTKCRILLELLQKLDVAVQQKQVSMPEALAKTYALLTIPKLEALEPTTLGKEYAQKLAGLTKFLDGNYVVDLAAVKKYQSEYAVELSKIVGCEFFHDDKEALTAQELMAGSRIVRKAMDAFEEYYNDSRLQAAIKHLRAKNYLQAKKFLDSPTLKENPLAAGLLLFVCKNMRDLTLYSKEFGEYKAPALLQNHTINECKLNAEKYLPELETIDDPRSKWFVYLIYNEISDAKEEYSSKKIAQLTASAEVGYIDAQFELAQLLAQGDADGNPKDDKTAERYYRFAAEQGHVLAQASVGVRCFERGEFSEAIPYLKSAANQGIAKSQALLAQCYARGLGIDKDEKEAFRWYTSAAENGDRDSRYQLALCYEHGKGVLLDKKQAIFWYSSLEEQGIFYNVCPKIFSLYQSLANEGDAEAQYWLARNLKGKDEASDKKAAQLFALAGVQGHVKAIFALAGCFELGRGVEKDAKAAMHFYKLAADKGKVTAALTVAKWYAAGIGAESNIEKIIHYLKLAAEKSEEAQAILGTLFQYGIGVEKNPKIAIDYYQKARRRSGFYGSIELAKCYENGEGVAKDLFQAIEIYSKYWHKFRVLSGDEHPTLAIAKSRLIALDHISQAGKDAKAQFVRAEYHRNRKEIDKAVDLWQLAAAQNHAAAHFQLGQYYRSVGNITKAIELYKKAADLNNPLALFLLAEFYEHGYGVQQDAKQAFKCYQSAAEQNHIPSLYALATAYEHGNGVEQNAPQAFKYYKLAAEAGDKLAWIRLAEYYEKGEHVQQDFKQAFNYYSQAASLGNAEALYKLGVYSLQGLGVPEDRKAARKYYRQAALHGSKPAKQAIERLNPSAATEGFFVARPVSEAKTRPIIQEPVETGEQNNFPASSS